MITHNSYVVGICYTFKKKHPNCNYQCNVYNYVNRNFHSNQGIPFWHEIACEIYRNSTDQLKHLVEQHHNKQLDTPSLLQHMANYCVNQYDNGNKLLFTANKHYTDSLVEIVRHTNSILAQTIRQQINQADMPQSLKHIPQSDLNNNQPSDVDNVSRMSTDTDSFAAPASPTSTIDLSTIGNTDSSLSTSSSTISNRHTDGITDTDRHTSVMTTRSASHTTTQSIETNCSTISVGTLAGRTQQMKIKHNKRKLPHCCLP